MGVIKETSLRRYQAARIRTSLAGGKIIHRRRATPLALILEMREPVMLPVYGPTGGTTCSQQPAVEFDPPIPLRRQGCHRAKLQATWIIVHWQRLRR
jgi:hypothetical protein